MGVLNAVQDHLLNPISEHCGDGGAQRCAVREA